MIVCHKRITRRRGDMLEIVLLILKIAGVIFVSVLGILIVLISIALFVPVRYRGDFLVSDKEDSEKGAVIAKARATWLLRFVRVYVTYEETPRLRLKLLFFTLMDTAEEKKVKRAENKKGKKKKDRAKQDTRETTENGEEDGRTKKEGISGKSDEGPGIEDKEEAAAKEDSPEEPGGESAKQKKESARKEKRTIKTGIYNILQTIRNFCDKLRGIKEEAEKIEKLWTSGHMAAARILSGRQLRYLLKHTKPRKLSGYLRFGFEDPSTTGYAMAAYGILYPIWNPKLSVEPDFEKQVLDCHILLKGKVRVWHFVRAALRMFLSRDVRRVIKDVRKF